MTNTTVNALAATLTPIPDLFETISMGHPWTDPAYRRETGCRADADQLHFRRDRALLFHTTTEAAIEGILADGPRLSEPQLIGWGNRSMPGGFWVSSRPLIPNDSDMWMPNICDEPWGILLVEAPMAVLEHRYVFETTWLSPQFALQLEDIQAIRLLHPGEINCYRSDEVLRRISKARGEYHLPSAYLDAIDQHVDLLNYFAIDEG